MVSGRLNTITVVVRSSKLPLAPLALNIVSIVLNVSAVQTAYSFYDAACRTYSWSRKFRLSWNTVWPPSSFTTPILLHRKPVLLVSNTLEGRKVLVSARQEKECTVGNKDVLVSRDSRGGFHSAFESSLCTGASHQNIGEPYHQSY